MCAVPEEQQQQKKGWLGIKEKCNVVSICCKMGNERIVGNGAEEVAVKASAGFPGPAISHGRCIQLRESFCRCLVSFNWERKKEVRREMCFLGLQLAGVLLAYRHQSLTGCHRCGSRERLCRVSVVTITLALHNRSQDRRK